MIRTLGDQYIGPSLYNEQLAMVYQTTVSFVSKVTQSESVK
jgi:hypothetical protein